MAQISTEKVLLPIALNRPVSGANGAIFETRFSLLNMSTAPVLIVGYDQNCLISSCQPTLTPPAVTFFPQLYSFSSDFSAEVPALFLRVDRNFIDSVTMQLRVQDTSRQAQTWGTTLPVVRESQALTSAAPLVDIPVEPQFRQTLRIYDFDPAPGRSVRIRMYGIDENTSRPPGSPDPLLLSLRRDLRTVTSGGGVNSHPGYVELNGIGSLPELAGWRRIRIDIEPVTTGLRFWAFVSVTNNETHHITVITLRR